MAHIEPVAPEDFPDALKPVLEMARARMGFVPNSMRTMALWPELLGAFAPLAGTVIAGGELDRGLKQMIAAVVSGAAGCRYCQAHTTHGAAHGGGVAAEKIANVWEYQQSELFSEAERAALDLALAAGQVPNAAEDTHFVELGKHYSDRQIVEIVAVISMFGFLNRWNDTMATTLEDAPAAFAEEAFSPDQWDLGKHGS